MLIKTRKEWLEENKILLIKVLEHITNVTNIGLSLSEVNNNLIISYPEQKFNNESTPRNLRSSTRAELLFCQDPDDGVKVRHRLYNVNLAVPGEIVAEIPNSEVNEKFIYECVIDFLEKVKNR